MRTIEDRTPGAAQLGEADGPGAAELSAASPPWRRRHRRLVGVVAVIAVVGLVLSIPGVPYHPQAALVADLIASDAGAIGAAVNPFERGHTGDPCGQLGSEFEVGNDLFKDRHFGFYASVWPSYGALTAMQVASLFPGHGACSGQVRAIVDSMDANYWDDSVAHGLPSAFSQGPAPFHVASDLPRVDDSLWMGLVLMLEYHSTKDRAFLDRAQQVFTLARRNWDPRGGGIYWEESGAGGQQRAVVSNAPAAILGLELFQVEHRPSELAWSERIFQWLEQHLLDPSTGLFDDHVMVQHGRSVLDKAHYTYVQGVMIGLMAMLSQVDPARYRLSSAVSLARRCLAYFDEHHSYGQPAFDAVFAASLLWTASLAHEPSFSAAARGAVKTAVAAEPRGQGDLLTEGSEDTLAQLERLSPNHWGDLLYLRPGRG